MWQDRKEARGFVGVGADLEDEALLAAIRQREFNFPVQTTWTKQSRVQCVVAVGGHDHLHVDCLIKTCMRMHMLSVQCSVGPEKMYGQNSSALSVVQRSAKI